MRLRAALAVAALTIVPLSIPAATVAAAAPALTQPVDSYANAIHQSVRVTTKTDTDADGKLDTIAVDIIRPREPAAAGQKIPVIMDASPYFTCCGRGNESQVKTYDANGVIKSLPLFYDNYFVPRGYAVIGVDVLGTGRSSGCGDFGGTGEVGSITAVIDWLNGRATATDVVTGAPVAASWANGSVGMIGKSYDGTLAEGVAATGVAGLKTVVPISAIDSWYYYTRSAGVVYSQNYVRFLLDYVGRTDGVCDRVRDALNAAADDSTGAYNSFWAERNYVAHVNRVTASVFDSHGVNDTNVQTNNLSSWWSALGQAGVARKLWLSQEGHVDPFDYRRQAWVNTLHRWFDYWLMGIDTGVTSDPAVTIERSANHFVSQASWPAKAHTALALGAGGLGDTSGGTASLTDHPNLTEAQVVANPDSAVAGRLMYRTATLVNDVRLSGTPTVTLRVQANETDTPLTAKLIDYGSASRPVGEGVQNLSTSSCWGESTADDSACYIDVGHRFATSTATVVSRGWVDAAYAGSISSANPLQPGQWRTITIPLRAQDDTIPAGHRIGLAITLSDDERTAPRSTAATVTLDLSQCSLSLPLVRAPRLAGQVLGHVAATSSIARPSVSRRAAIVSPAG